MVGSDWKNPSLAVAALRVVEAILRRAVRGFSLGNKGRTFFEEISLRIAFQGGFRVLGGDMRAPDGNKPR